MGSPQRQNMRAQQREHLYRLRYRAATQGMYVGEPGGLTTAIFMTSLGVAFLLGFSLAIINGATLYASPLLLFGSSLFLFGVILLIFIMCEKTAKRMIRAKKHCGCCYFYQPQDEVYDVGLCQADPREGFVQRTHSCPYFRHSERAMVRDRLAQKPEMLQQIRIRRVDTGESSSD